MGHYAKVDSTGTVTSVIVADSDFISAVGSDSGDNWIVTSPYIRGGVFYDSVTGKPDPDQSKAVGLGYNFAGVGRQYSDSYQGFIASAGPKGWALNTTTLQYEAPVPAPRNGNQYSWDSSQQNWFNTSNLSRFYWDSLDSYPVGHHVIHNGKWFISLADVSIGDEPDESYDSTNFLTGGWSPLASYFEYSDSTFIPENMSDSAWPLGTFLWWLKRKDDLVSDVDSIQGVISDTAGDSATRISALQSFRTSYSGAFDREDSYSDNDVPLDSLKGTYNNIKGSILEIQDNLEEGFLTRRWNSAYFGDSGLGNTDDSVYDAGFRTETPTSTFVTTVMDFDENDPKQSRELNGWFKSPYTGDVTFYLATDDMGYMWVGDQVLFDSSMSNADMSNPGTHGTEEDSHTVSMSEGTYYPIRIRYGNVGSGSAELQGYYEHSGQAKTNDWTGVVFHNVDSTDGGF